MLIRDSGAPFHPIIGISALSSAAIRLGARDKFIGWDTDQIITDSRTNPTNEIAEWILMVLNKSFKGIYLVDFIRDGVITANPTAQITNQTIDNLRQIALKQKEAHYRLMDGPEYKAEKRANINSDEDWELQALTPLFRSKRAGELANLLETWLIIYSAYIGKSGEKRLSNLLSTDAGRNAFSKVIRISRSMTVGTEIADLTICGAVAPYNHIAGGKLVAMLAASPAAVCGYSERYSASSSIIASSMAGRKVSRSANLVFVGTTSLYGKRPNQYDRIAYPASLANGLVNQQIKYHFIPDNQADDGKSKNTKGVGTFHFGPNTLRAMESFTIAMRGGWKVNNVFGEGASPKLRALRNGLDALGLNSDELLIHGIGKCIYGANMTTNTSQYLLGIDENPSYIFSLSDPVESTEKISEWWYDRWVKPRVSREDIQKKISSETLVYPIRHNAKVKLPESDDSQLDLQQQ